VASKRVSLNLRVDPEKYAILEEMRSTGFGLAETQRTRSDVYNEILGYGVQTNMLRMDMGDREFERLWKLIHKINWRKINIEGLAKFVEG